MSFSAIAISSPLVNVPSAILAPARKLSSKLTKLSRVRCSSSKMSSIDCAGASRATREAASALYKKGGVSLPFRPWATMENWIFLNLAAVSQDGSLMSSVEAVEQLHTVLAISAV
jgi:hypothetical protein